MWDVYEHKRLVRQLRKLPTDVLKRYEKWKDIVTISGPRGPGAIRGLRDEALRGEWSGDRSSRLGGQYRVIYRIAKKEVSVLVIDLSAHDYRRR